VFLVLGRQHPGFDLPFQRLVDLDFRPAIRTYNRIHIPIISGLANTPKYFNGRSFKTCSILKIKADELDFG